MEHDGTAGADTSPSAEAADLEALRLLTDETRWRLLRALRYSDCQVGELVAATGLPQNLVSYHLGVLRQAGLVQQHRSDADARVNYYGVNLGGLAQRYRQLGVGLAIPTEHRTAQLPAVTVIFLCRANSARSQMAEGWLRSLSGGRITVRSAGTQPAALHPLAEQVMAEVGIDIGHHQSKHVDALAQLRPDVVVTVCDIAREACAVWAQAATRLHWSIPDPVAEPNPAEQPAVFRQARDELRQRVAGMLTLWPTGG